MKKFLQLATSRHVAKNALKIALVVGSLLNLINNAQNILEGGNIPWAGVLLNFVIPYCVASYSAAKNEISRR